MYAYVDVARPSRHTVWVCFTLRTPSEQCKSKTRREDRTPIDEEGYQVSHAKEEHFPRCAFGANTLRRGIPLIGGGPLKEVPGLKIEVSEGASPS